MMKIKDTILHKQGLWKDLIYDESTIVIHSMNLEITLQALLVENVDNK